MNNWSLTYKKSGNIYRIKEIGKNVFTMIRYKIINNNLANDNAGFEFSKDYLLGIVKSGFVTVCNPIENDFNEWLAAPESGL